MARDFLKEIEGVTDRAADRASEICDARIRKLMNWFGLKFPKRRMELKFINGYQFVEVDGEEVDIYSDVPLWKNRGVPSLKPISEAMYELATMCDVGHCEPSPRFVCEPKYAFSDYGFKPGDFNYKLAWYDWARVQFQCLPADVRAIYEDIRDHYTELSQVADLSVRWPTEDEENKAAVEIAKHGHHDHLRSRFENIPAEWLARAVSVIHSYGHWGSGWAIPNDGGAYWKFESLAKQVLIDKGRENCTWDDYKCDTDKYKVLSAVERAIDGALNGSGLSRHSLTHVNHRPHPFVIGPKHLENSKSMYLDPDCAPCAWRGPRREACNLSHAEHVSDHVVVIAGLTEPVSDDHKTAIETLAPVLEEHGIDGMVFVAG
jgi:hypothetical protein